MRHFSGVNVRLLYAFVLTECLAPSSCNVVNVLTMFGTITGDFVSSNFNLSLVERGVMSQRSCSAVLCFGIMLSVFFCVTLCLYSKLVTSFCGRPVLISLDGMIFLVLPFRTMKLIRGAVLRGRLGFGGLYVVSVSSSVVSTVITVVFTCVCRGI